MKKLILTLIFIVLLILTAYYLIYRKGSSLNKEEKMFSISVNKDLNKIILQNKEGIVTLIREQDRWTINEKEARIDLVNTLIGVSEGLDAFSPVDRHSEDSVLHCLKKGTHVTFFKNNKNLNAFTICKWENAIYGIRDNYEHPYRLTLRGFPNIDLTKIYSTDENIWLTNLVINIDPVNIKSILIEYPDNPSGGFKLNKKESRFELVNPKSNKPFLNTDTEIISEYLEFFRDISYFPVTDSTQTKKEILNIQKPFFHLKIENMKDSVIELSGYAKQALESDQIDHFKFYGINIDNNVILLKYNDFDPILVQADYFLKK